MGDRILIAYASKCGSTAEVAQAIGEELCRAGAAVDVRAVQEVKDLQGYRAVVLGTAIRMGRPLGEANAFTKNHGAALAALPFALFSVGVQMNDDTPENRASAESYLQPIVQIKQPVSTGLFGGKVDPARLSPFLRFFISRLKEGEMAPGDHRDWQAIRAWAGEVAPLLRQG